MKVCRSRGATSSHAVGGKADPLNRRSSFDKALSVDNCGAMSLCHKICVSPECWKWLVYLCVCVSVAKSDSRRTSVIRTKYGLVQGRVHRVPLQEGQEQIEVFLGIRYATAPIGDFRWQPTRAPAPWSGILQAVSSGPVCPQRLPDNIANGNVTQALNRMPKSRVRYLQLLLPHLRRQSEDCLYLNLFVPTMRKDAKKKKSLLPVLVFVHGDSFVWGAANVWDGRALAAAANALVVTFNYRLGVLGFLKTDDSTVVSNYGLMDQLAALQWVQENAVYFGGDADAVTLMGHGTGAACIDHILHSQAMAPGLVQRVILMSGSSFASWALVKESHLLAEQLADLFNCSKSDKESCLKSISADDLVATEIAGQFGPSWDGVTVSNKRKSSPKLSALIGVASGDGFDLMSERQVRRGPSAAERDARLTHLAQSVLDVDHVATATWLALANEYGANEHNYDHKNGRQQLLEALNDALYRGPALRSALALNSSVYFYHYRLSAQGGPYGHLRGSDVGATHGSELALVFGLPLLSASSAPLWPHVTHSFSKVERRMSQHIIRFWANFIHQGDPNEPRQSSKKSTESLQWPRFDARQKRYLDIVAPRPSVGSHLRPHAMSLWLSLLPKLEQLSSSDSMLQSPSANSSDRPCSFSNATLSASISRMELQGDDALAWAGILALSSLLLCLLNVVCLIFTLKRRKSRDDSINSVQTQSRGQPTLLLQPQESNPVASPRHLIQFYDEHTVEDNLLVAAPPVQFSELGESEEEAR